MATCSSPADMWQDDDEVWHYQRYREVDRDQYGDPRGEIKVSCKHCEGCRLAHADTWASRIMHEARMYPCGWAEFLTLTYDRAHLPLRGWLHYQDVQAFLKRLRIYGERHNLLLADRAIRYVCAGEYGGEFRRPHYHMILYGFRFPDKKERGKRSGYPVYSSELLNELWQQGSVNEIGCLTHKSAGYVARYAMKGGPGAWHPEDWTDPYGKVHLAPREFLKVSRRPGIGHGWIEKYWKDVFPWDHVIRNGHECGVPDYYLRWLENHDPDMYAAIKAKRKARAEELEAKGERTPSRLAAMQEVALARLKFGKEQKTRW